MPYWLESGTYLEVVPIRLCEVHVEVCSDVVALVHHHVDAVLTLQRLLVSHQLLLLEHRFLFFIREDKYKH